MPGVLNGDYRIIHIGGQFVPRVVGRERVLVLEIVVDAHTKTLQRY